MNLKAIPLQGRILAVILLLVLAISLPILLLRGSFSRSKGSVDDDSGTHSTAHFRDSAESAGIGFRMRFLPNEQGEKFKINLYDHGCGVAVGDYDDDGWEDIYFVNQLGENALYRNKGDGTFADTTEKAGVGLGDRICVGATFADYDNDGNLDLFVTSTRGGNVLFRNVGEGKFEDVTKTAGVEGMAHSQSAAFFDYNNDGFLDLFVTNTAKWTMDSFDRQAHYFVGLPDLFQMLESPVEHNVLFENNRKGGFEDVTEKVGLKGKGWGGDISAFDYDRDGFLDLFVTNMFGASQLYHNNEGKTFTDQTKEILGRTSWGAIGCNVTDFNNDGRLDLFVADMHSDMWLFPRIDPRTRPEKELHTKHSKMLGPPSSLDPEMMAKQEQMLGDLVKIRYDEVFFGNTFYKQLPSGKFEEVSDKAGLETFWPWGLGIGDFDNDGYEDVYIPSGMGYPYQYWPSALMMNNGNETFTNRATEEGIEPLASGEYHKEPIGKRKAARSSRCAAVADFTGEGRLDIVVNNFNDAPFLFRNHFPRANYIAFRLTGTVSNRDAIGATVTLRIGDETMIRQVKAASGYLSHSSRTLHFGLGTRDKIDAAEIRWPSGQRQVIGNPTISKLHKIAEPEMQKGSE